MNKKAVQLGLNTIVVAVIALTVMTVVLFFFTGQFGDATDEIKSCESRLGKCVSESQCDGRVLENTECPGSEVCCFDPMSSANEDDE